MGLLRYADRTLPDALPEVPLDLRQQEGDVLVLGQVQQGLEVLAFDLDGPLEVVVDAFLGVLLVLPDQPEAEVAPLALLEVLELLGGEEAGGLHLPLQLLGDPLLEYEAAEDGLVVAVGRLPRQPLLALLDYQPAGQPVEKV